MNNFCRKLAFIAAVALITTGCGGRDKDNPSRWYIESKNPSSVTAFSPINEELTVKLYSHNSKNPSFVKEYGPKTTPKDILASLPKTGDWQVIAFLGGEGNRRIYKAELHQGVLTSLENK